MGRQKWTRRFERRFERLIPDRIEVPRRYKRATGRELDLKAPRELTAKLNWMKFNYLTPLMIDCSDKMLVRDVAKHVLGKDIGVPVLRENLQPEDLTPENITEKSFVLKVNHDSGGVLVCRDRDTFDWAGARRFFKQRLRNNFYWAAREPVYWPLKPQIFMEECLPESREAPLLDYKIWCFGGKAKFIQVVTVAYGDKPGDRSFEHQFYDVEWTLLPIIRDKKIFSGELARPGFIDGLLEMAEALAQPFPFVRVDLFAPADGRQFYVGEMTMFPSGGFVPFTPHSFEEQAGDWVELPEPNDPWAVARAWTPLATLDTFPKAADTA